jgi:Fe-S cluster assembly protein SufD
MSHQVVTKPAETDLAHLLGVACGSVSQVVPSEYPLDAEIAAWLQQIRDQAASGVRGLSLPTRRDEEWRFTDLSPLLPVKFQASQPASASIEEWSLPEAETSRLVFVNGIFTPALSTVTGLPEGVIVGNLAGREQISLEKNPFEPFLAQQPGADEVFTALNTAGLKDAAVVWVPRNVAVEVPIHLLFISVTNAVPVYHSPRCLVVAQPGSSVTVVEEYVSQGNAETPAFTNAVTEIVVSENAQVSHQRIQREFNSAFHIGKTAVNQARNSHYDGCAISLGARLSRHNWEVFQAGEGTDTVIDGLTVLKGEQVGDTHSSIALNHPHGTTNQLHKCIVDDRAHAIFNGKVFVPKPAQLTNANQLSQNLLLSPKARVDTKPQLEITADNVKCSHGATVSQLEAEEVFYLQSRGLDRQTSCQLLIEAFAGEIIQKVPVESLQETLLDLVMGSR